MTYGYIRVSSKDQNETKQIIALEEYGVPSDYIFTDKQSGKSIERHAYKQLITELNAEDLLVIQSIDRLGHNYDEILEQWKIITKEIRANIVVLDMPLLDTRKHSPDLKGTYVADLVVQILSYVAQTERKFIKQRQAEGIAAAKAEGVHFGRKPVALPPNFESVRLEYANGKLSLRDAAKKLKMPKSTFHRHARAASQNIYK